MANTLNFIQNLNAHSVANAPASITINCSATTANNMLLFTVTATSSGTPTIASPGGSWVLVYNTSVAGLAYAMYMQLNNAGGITTVTSNLATTTAGGATAGFLEISTSPQNQPWGLEFQTSYNQVGTVVPWNVPSGPSSIEAIQFYYVHRAASTFTPVGSPFWTPGYGSGVSTGSTTNAQQDGLNDFAGEYINLDVGGGTLGASVTSSVGYARFTSGVSFPFNFPTVPIGGKAGYMQPQFFQGMVGG